MKIGNSCVGSFAGVHGNQLPYAATCKVPCGPNHSLYPAVWGCICAEHLDQWFVSGNILVWMPNQRTLVSTSALSISH